MKSDKNVYYFKGLLKNKQKKQVAAYFDELTLERIDMLIKVFSSISDSKSFSRNMLIEEAMNKYLEESEKYLKEEYDIDIGVLIEEAQLEKYDTVILSSNGKGFENTFLGETEEKCWYPCRISDDREGNLQYITIYRGQPESAITHYAKIKKFEYSPEKGCKVCFFDGEPIPLPNKITLGNKDSCFFIGAKYTKLESLLNVEKADDILII